MWSGAATAIPTGWKLCDGMNGTPDLRDKFVVGAGGVYAPAATGGHSVIELAHSHTVNDHVLTVGEMPTHNHGISDPRHTHVGINGGHYVTSGNAGTAFNCQQGSNYGFREGVETNSAATGISVNYSGGNAAHNHGSTSSALTTKEILPPYYALCFIMKTAN